MSSNENQSEFEHFPTHIKGIIVHRTVHKIYTQYTHTRTTLTDSGYRHNDLKIKTSTQYLFNFLLSHWCDWRRDLFSFHPQLVESSGSLLCCPSKTPKKKQTKNCYNQKCLGCIAIQLCNYNECVCVHILLLDGWVRMLGCAPIVRLTTHIIPLTIGSINKKKNWWKKRGKCGIYRKIRIRMVYASIHHLSTYVCERNLADDELMK